MKMVGSVSQIWPCVYFSMSDFGGRHFVNLVTWPESKNTNLRVGYFLHLKTVKANYIVQKECISAIHLHYLALERLSF